MPTIHNKRRRFQSERKPHDRKRKETDFNYNASAWRKDRKAHLLQNPLCANCLKLDRYTPATVSDHIKPINEGGEIWDWQNRQALCATCHNQKSGREAHSRFNKDKSNE